jgi:hypothetical protein
MMADTFRRAQAEAVVAKRRSATMEFSDPAKQLEYEITLAEAALAEQAKAAVSDVGALVDGWKLVPVECTEDMWMAFGADFDFDAFQGYYSRLLSAAPSPDGERQGGDDA